MEEEEGDTALGAELDEVCAFEGGFGEEDAVVGEDADGVGVDAGEAWWGGLGGFRYGTGIGERRKEGNGRKSGMKRGRA